MNLTLARAERVGVVPAAGYATRQALTGFKERQPIAERPVTDSLIERMVRGGCTHILLVTPPETSESVG